MHRKGYKKQTKAIKKPSKKMCCCAARMARLDNQHK